MKTFCRETLVAVVGVVLATTGCAAAYRSTNPVTAESILPDLGIKCMMKPYLLAFKSQVDDRPLHVENALLAVQCSTDKWCLVTAHRHPKEKNEKFHHWNIDAQSDSSIIGIEYYNYQPTKSDIEEFLKEREWEFRAHPDFRLVRGEVYSKVWQQVFDYKPNYKFPKPKG